MPDAPRAESASAARQLRLLLQLFGVLCITAFFPFVMPVQWMDWGHQQLGLGPFPADKPIAVYLARSTSALCGLYGAFALILATDIVRYQKLIQFHIVGLFSIGSIGTLLAYQCGMPTFWISIDFVSILIICPWKYILYKRVFS